MKIKINLMLLFLISIVMVIVQTVSVPSFAASNNKLDGAIVLYSGSTFAIVKNKVVSIDAKDPTTYVFVREGSTYVPARFIVENLGGTISADSKAGTATIKTGNKTAKLKIGENEIVVNNKKLTMSGAMLKEGNKLYLPLRSVCKDLFDKEVFWNKSLIVISGSKKNI